GHGTYRRLAPFPPRRSSDLGPPVSTTLPAARSPAVVRTPRREPSGARSRPVNATPSRSSTPVDARASRYAETLRGGVSQPSPSADRKSTRLNSSHDQTSYAV